MDTAFRRAIAQRLATRFPGATLSSLVGAHGSPLLILDAAQLIYQLDELRHLFPRVTPHYAVKACAAPEVLQILAANNCHFDVASSGEIDALEHIAVTPDRIIHTYPHKKTQDVERARAYGIGNFVVDCDQELDLLAPYADEMTINLRISYPNDIAHIDLSHKFGVDYDDALRLALAAAERGLRVTSLCFHVGSQLDNPEPFVDGLKKTAALRDRLRENGIKIEQIDIGGGFPIDYVEPAAKLETFAAVVNPLLDSLFPDETIISEPGRYIVGPAMTLVSSVVAVTKRHGEQWVFMDEGIYGSLADQVISKMEYCYLSEKELRGELPTERYVLAGPTCDSLDIVSESYLLPPTKKGDLIAVPHIGAYSWSLATRFNSLPVAPVVVV